MLPDSIWFSLIKVGVSSSLWSLKSLQISSPCLESSLCLEVRNWEVGFWRRELLRPQALAPALVESRGGERVPSGSLCLSSGQRMKLKESHVPCAWTVLSVLRAAWGLRASDSGSSGLERERCRACLQTVRAEEDEKTVTALPEEPRGLG